MTIQQICDHCNVLYDSTSHRSCSTIYPTLALLLGGRLDVVHNCHCLVILFEKATLFSSQPIRAGSHPFMFIHHLFHWRHWYVQFNVHIEWVLQETALETRAEWCSERCFLEEWSLKMLSGRVAFSTGKGTVALGCSMMLSGSVAFSMMLSSGRVCFPRS